MAKGNLFLGSARGSVGDVTFYTRNGEQISRVRRRSIKNPNTQGQLYQRAVMATVIKAYQAGAEIFDHSFEGVSTGAASQARFQKINMNLLRQLIDKDIALSHGDEQSYAAVVSRGSAWPVANPYRISTGSLTQPLFAYGFNGDNPSLLFVTLNIPAEVTVAQWLEQYGIIDDDIFTIVVFAITDSADWSIDDDDRFQRDWQTRFGFLRLRVKTEAVSSTALLANAKFQDVFEISGSENYLPAAYGIDEPVLMSHVVDGAVAGSIGVIRSRENSGLRSTCDMYTRGTLEWGIIGKYIPEAWDPLSEQLGQSPLILEGGPIGRL